MQGISSSNKKKREGKKKKYILCGKGVVSGTALFG